MSKARTLADFISDGSPLADGTISVSEVSGAAPLESPTFTGTITSTGNIALGDLDELRLGGNAMRLYYDSNNNYTVLDSNGTQGFRFMGTNGLSVEIDGSAVTSFGLNGVTISPNGTEKLQVYSGGSIFSGNLRVNDDIKLGFGQFGTDLEIYHDTASTTNKLVGDLTQTGKLTTDATDLSAIAKSITDTAVDVFVYDTSKDSDGGAWRKRTQHTSWYNETLNTATRGSRKEFPAVAVIVAESNQVTIYDGDDPDLPMWMVFNYNSGAIYYTHAVSCVSMLNGILTIGISSTYGVSISNFVTENIQNIRNIFGVYTYNGSIVDRNSSSGQTLNAVNSLVNGAVNDVAMTVLPNAPIDAATGLPVPTIAVATNGGVSVIKDDGTVVDITWSSDGIVGDVTFDTDNNIVVGIGAGTGAFNYSYRVYALPSSDLTESAAYVNSSNDLFDAGPTDFSVSSYTPTVKYLGNTANTIKITPNHIGSSTGGLTCIDRNDLSVSYITSTYNTGWMNGDIKLATLSDTDDTDVTGSELIDQTFSNWNLNNATVDTSTYYSSPNSLKTTSTSTIAKSPTFSLVAGKTYVLTFKYKAPVGGPDEYGEYYLYDGNGSEIKHWWVNAPDANWHTHSYTFTSSNSGSSGRLWLLSDDTEDIYFDDVSIRLAEEDRSVNGNGLQVFGTVTKNPVATGADLVGYSGFSTSNYLEQPYNADLDYGTTGDFEYSWWMKTTSTAGGSFYVFERSEINDPSNRRIECRTTTQTNLQVYASGGVISLTTNTIPANTWTKVNVVGSGQTITVYINGVSSSSAFSTSLNLTSATPTSVLSVGVRAHFATKQSAFNGSLALFRTGATAPSPEQIKKIYEDEKVLFQENAQATLYGSSDAVTALAYDHTTELLHVGTSAGRSVFQGLRRVDNTTDAVGAAISASNGLVAED